MQTIAFETHTTNGIIQIPETFKEWYGKTLKVMLLYEETVMPVTSPSPPMSKDVDSLTLMKELSYAQPGRHWSREELNERERCISPPDLIDALLETPLQIADFVPLSRAEIYESRESCN